MFPDFAAKLMVAEAEQIGGYTLVELRSSKRGFDKFFLNLGHSPGQVDG